MISHKSNPFLALTLGALLVTGCDRPRPSEQTAATEPPKPEAKTNSLPWPKNDPLLESDMAKVYAHLIIAEEALQKSVDRKILATAIAQIPAEHRAEGMKQLQTLMINAAREHLDRAITIWKNHPSQIAQSTNVSIISGLAEELARKQGAVITADEARPMAECCRRGAEFLQATFGSQP